MKTFSAKTGEVERKWKLIDLNGKTLGRAASQIASILRGKDKPTYTPHGDVGDFVVAINAEKIKLTGKKLTDKKYYDHSGYIGGMKIKSAGELLKRHPEELITRAVKGMLPHNTLSEKLIKKLKVYAGEGHPHASQQPQVHELKF
ncbi:MAG: 50S ribosomal protein L13 [bacterium]